MRYLFALLTIGSCWTQVLSQSIDLSAPIEVAPPRYGFMGPKIGIDDQGSPITYFGKKDSLFAATWVGQGFATPIYIPAPGLRPFVNSQEGPGMAVAGDKVFISFQDLSSGKLYLVSSYNRGVSFAAPIELPAKGILPMVGIDSAGHPLVTYLTENTGVGLARSETFGQTFSPPVVTSTASNGQVVCECCPPEVITGPGNQVFSVFRNNDHNTRDIWMTQSRDGGLSFPYFADLDNLNWQINSCPASGPDPLMGPNTLRSVWFSGAVSPTRTFISEVDLTSLAVTQVPLNHLATGDQNFPKIAGNGDTLGVVWTEYVNTSTEIFMSWSVTGINGLAAHVHNLTQTPQIHERFADIAYSNGTFHVVYESFQEEVVKYMTADLDNSTGFSNLATNPNIFGIEVDYESDAVEAYVSGFRSGKLDWRVIDLTGKTIRDGHSSNSHFKFPISGLSPGIYFLGVEHAGTLSLRKFLIR